MFCQVIKDKATKQIKDKANKKTINADCAKKSKGKLTEKALADHDTNLDPADMNLDDKLKILRDKGFDAVTLNGADFTKLNLRFSQTALAKMAPQIKEACDYCLRMSVMQCMLMSSVCLFPRNSCAYIFSAGLENRQPGRKGQSPGTTRDPSNLC